MLLVLAITLLGVFLSSRAIRTGLPFESLLAVGGAAIIAMALFQFGRLA